MSKKSRGAATDNALVIVEQLADQAEQAGHYGLQDANLLLAEAIRKLPSDSTSQTATDLSAIITQWAALVKKYPSAPEQTAKAMVDCLRRPELKIAMHDDEFEMLQGQLALDISTEEEPAPDTETESRNAALASALSQTIDTAEDERSAPVSSVAQELVNLLQIQTEHVRTHLAGIVIGEKQSTLNGLQQAKEELECFANAAKTAGFEGLSQVCVHINLNMQHFLDHISAFDAERLRLLREWLEQAQAYLASFNKNNAGLLIVSGLSDEQWPLPLSLEKLVAILLKTRTESASIGELSEPARIKTATAADVSLTLPDDVNRELLELLLQELPMYTQQFSEAVQRMQSSGSEKDVEVAQRVAHTLKGSANTVGVKGIAVLTHHLEDILTACSKTQKLPGPALANSLLTASDCLENMSEALLGFSPPPDDALAVLQDILDWANRFDQGELPDSKAEEAPLTHTQAPEADVDNMDATEHTEPSVAAPLQASMMRVTTDKIESLFRLSGESIILNAQAQESMRNIRIQLQAMQMQFALLKQLGVELEQLIDLKDLSGRSPDLANENFDALEMDQYNELHTASKRMAEAAVDAREIGLDINKEVDKINEVLDFQQRAAIEAQEVAMKTRLMPVSSVVQRLQRSHRQTCRLIGKQSHLIVTGEDLLIDGDTLNALVDPLMHILRNALDHGIESESERLAQRKPRQGQIRLDFSHEGNSILIRCQDDGRGLNFGDIRAAAEKRGLVQPGHYISEDELKRFILRPNFSTRTVTTQTSGRGVGMDAVYAQVKAMGGKLTMESKAGHGLTLKLSIPLPLSLTDALLVTIGPHRIAIAHKGIRQLYYSGGIELITENGQERLLLDDHLYAVTRLNDVLQYPGNTRQQHFHGVILLVQHDDKSTAVLIDSIIDSRAVVIKSLGKYIGKIPGYIGATIFGDGSVTPVIDMPELLRAPPRAVKNLYADPMEIDEPEFRLPTIMVVDDSLSQRRALEQMLSDAGFKVKTARDGIEAVELLPHIKPDLLLTDLEMPRMNGIELTAHIRAQFSQTTLPIIMITSRTTQKHRQMAEAAGIDFYFTKPVRDEELLVKMQTLMERAADHKSRVAMKG